MGLPASPGNGLDEFSSTEPVGTIVCFIIAPSYRGQGIATRLLQATLEGFRQQGVTTVEAFSRKESDKQAENYHGPLSMYLEAGFTPVEEREGFVRVRKYQSAA